MSHFTDQQYLRTRQYKDASNLNARIQIHRRFSTNEQSWQQWVFDRFALPARCRILDVGCGPADLWLKNRDRIPADWTIVLSDVSPGMLRKARHNLGSSHHRITYRVLDAQALPFPDESFDAVVANHMLYHVPDRDRVLYEIHRVLQLGGTLYATTNGLRHLRELRDLVANLCANARAANVAVEFGLENGAEQLSRYFANVTRHRQENALIVTEAKPLIAYVLSMTGETLLGQNVEAVDRVVREQIASHGAIHIQKDSGLFTAIKA